MFEVVTLVNRLYRYKLLTHLLW